MKHLFPSTALALFIGLGLSSMSTNTFAANSWDNLQPDRDEVIASLNVVELLKRHHYSKPPLDDARSVIIYDSYLKLLDPSRSYFLASDILSSTSGRPSSTTSSRAATCNPASPSTSATWTASKRVWTSPWRS